MEIASGQASIAAEQRLRDEIAPALADLRIDIALHERGHPLTPFERIAMRDSVAL